MINLSSIHKMIFYTILIISINICLHIKNNNIKWMFEAWNGFKKPFPDNITCWINSAESAEINIWRPRWFTFLQELNKRNGPFPVSKYFAHHAREICGSGSLCWWPSEVTESDWVAVFLTRQVSCGLDPSNWHTRGMFSV